MTEITIELSDNDLMLLRRICDDEACSWDKFFSVMIRSFDTLCPFHLETLFACLPSD